MAAVAQRHGGDIAVRQEEVGVMRDQLRALGQSPRRMPAPVL
jgi:hypothetical protein